MRRLLSLWPRIKADSPVIVDLTEPTDVQASQEIAEDAQDLGQAIVSQMVEVISAPKKQTPPPGLPLDKLKEGLRLRGPYREVRGISIVGLALHDHLDREDAIWRAITPHPHILQFLGTCKITRQWFYGVPYIELCPMLIYLQRKPNADKAALVFQVCDALTALHSSNILHGQVGIKSLLVSNNRALLYDFCQAETRTQGFEGDVFDFGVTVAE
ncbi:hypothetical protein FRB90_007494, partial [Tulasnella sp. 427]